MEHGKFETIDHGPKSQLEGLLVEPWKRSALGRLADNELVYVLPIDALDELERERGSEFLRALFDAIKQHQLPGLKFLVTSRLDQALVDLVQSFQNKQVCRLGDVPLAETSADIKLFLDENLGECATEEQICQLVSDAAGLFIYAATVVEYIKGRDPDEQKSLLGRLIAASPSPAHHAPRGVTTMLDNLYTQILEGSLIDPRDQGDANVFDDSLSILHTFLCTIERTSVPVVIDILNGTRDESKAPLQTGDANGILRRLHAVLYVKGSQVMSFHKSFPDFIFDKSRSRRFFCNQDQHHRHLAEGCFNVMNEQLHFNIAEIPSSYLLDRDNATLESFIDTNISPALRYACGSWTGHLTGTPSKHAGDLLFALHDFLQLRFLFWIEVMNLLRYRGRCQGMLRDARNWVSRAKEPVVWARELAGATAFALYHNASGAASSTPHLYISSLATFPRNSALVQQWRYRFEAIPEFTNASGASGQALLASFVAEGPVYAVAVAPDGATIAHRTSSKIHIWDISTGEKVITLEGHTDDVYSVSFSPDGTQVVSGSCDRSIRVWDVSTGEKVKIFEGHTGDVDSVAFSPTGKQVVSGSWDGSVRVWDVSTREVVKTLEGHTGPVNSVAFSPDGKQIVSGSWDKSVRVWDVLTGEVVKTFKGHTDTVNSVAFSPNGTHIASGSDDKSVRVWDMSTGKEVKIFEGHMDVNSVAFSPNGTQVASGSDDKLVRIWDLLTGEVVMTFEGHKANSVAFSADGAQVVSGSRDRSVRVWDLSAGSEVKLVEGHTDTITSGTFSPNGKQVASGSRDKSVRLWDMATGKEVRIFEGHKEGVNTVVFSPDGTQVASGSSDNSICVWNPLAGKEVKTLEGHTDSIKSVAFSPDGTQVVSGSTDKSVRVWDLSTGKEVKTFDGHGQTAFVMSVAFSASGTHVASGAYDGFVRLWDVSTEEKARIFDGHTRPVTSVSFSPDGKQVVSGSRDKSVRVWDLSTGVVERIFKGHKESVNTVFFSPDGTQVASGSSDNSVRVWDMSTGEVVMTFEGHTAPVNTVGFSPDGTQIVSGSTDTSVCVWNFSSEQGPLHWIRQKSLEGDNTGWLLSPFNSSDYLMFVPLSANPTDESNILTIPSTSARKLNFSKAKLGDRWAECYTPKSL